ncbi:MAG: hypothetical protein OIF55_12980 [Amphritea sp.]|nr:hypothetical protein [Amphritea sp.]
MNWLRLKYAGLDSRERKQLLLILIFSLVGGYLFFSAWLWQQMFDAEKMANRRENRIETRIGKIEPPKLEKGVSEAVLKQQLELQALLQGDMRKLAAALLPLDDAGAREQFKLELAKLAELNSLRVSRLKTANSDIRPPISEISGAELRRYLVERPVFDLALSGSYLNLLHFVNGLQRLTYRAHVTDMSMEPGESTDGRLKIQLRIQV